jgi:hypothetical protein
MNFITLLKIWVKHKMGKIKREDLEALGNLAGFVGGYMNDFASKTEAQEARNLFKRGLDPKALMEKAVKDNQDYTADVIPEEAAPPPDIQNEAAPPPAIQNEAAPAFRYPQPHPAPAAPPTAPPTAPPVARELQTEFSFVEQQVSEELGSVADVVAHFDRRLDEIEEWMKMINAFMVEIRKNTEKKPRKPRAKKPVVEDEPNQ